MSSACSATIFFRRLFSLLQRRAERRATGRSRRRSASRSRTGPSRRTSSPRGRRARPRRPRSERHRASGRPRDAPAANNRQQRDRRRCSRTDRAPGRSPRECEGGTSRRPGPGRGLERSTTAPARPFMASNKGSRSERAWRAGAAIRATAANGGSQTSVAVVSSEDGARARASGSLGSARDLASAVAAAARRRSARVDRASRLSGWSTYRRPCGTCRHGYSRFQECGTVISSPLQSELRLCA